MIKGINAIGRFGVPSGTTIAGFALIEALLIQGIEVCILDLGATLEGRPADNLPVGVEMASCYQDLRYAHTFILDSVFMVPPIMEFAEHAFRGQQISSVVYWELEWLPREWEKSFSQLDTILAPTQYVQDAIARSYHLKSILCPLIPIQLFNKETAINHSGTFTFFMHFDALSTLARKNPYAALEAFTCAFGTRNDVRLLVKVWESDEWKFDRALVAPYLDEALSISFLYEHLSYDSMMRLISSCDAYISLHRAEGLGLGMLEAMSLGKPVIATDYSGNRDFLNEHSGIPIPYTRIEVDSPQDCYQAAVLGCVPYWAEPSITSAAQAMKRLTEDSAYYTKISQGALQQFMQRKDEFYSLKWLRQLDYERGRS